MDMIKHIVIFILVGGCGSPEPEASEPAPSVGVSPPPADQVGATPSPEPTSYVLASYEVFPFDPRATAPFGNTGLAIDPERGWIFQARYQFAVSSVISIRTRDNKQVGLIDVTRHIDHIEGLAYRSATDTLLVWGNPRGVALKPFEAGYIIVEVQLDGSVVGSWHTGREDNYPGQLTVDEEHNRVWVKAGDRYTAHAYDLDTHVVVDAIQFDVGGEGIAYDPKHRQFWLADGDNLYVADADGKRLHTYPVSTLNHQSEGLIFDPLDQTLWLNADEGIHGGFVDGNRVWHLNPQFHRGAE